MQTYQPYILSFHVFKIWLQKLFCINFLFSSVKLFVCLNFRVDEIMKKSANSSQCNVLNSIATSPVQWMRYLNISESSSKFTNSYSFKVLLLSSQVYTFLKALLSDTWIHIIVWLTRLENIKSKLNQILQRLFSFICKLFCTILNSGIAISLYLPFWKYGYIYAWIIHFV